MSSLTAKLVLAGEDIDNGGQISWLGVRGLLITEVLFYYYYGFSTRVRRVNELVMRETGDVNRQKPR
jgi:hypothetical protein